MIINLTILYENGTSRNIVRPRYVRLLWIMWRYRYKKHVIGFIIHDLMYTSVDDYYIPVIKTLKIGISIKNPIAH